MNGLFTISVENQENGVHLGNIQDNVTRQLDLLAEENKHNGSFLLILTNMMAVLGIMCQLEFIFFLSWTGK